MAENLNKEMAMDLRECPVGNTGTTSDPNLVLLAQEIKSLGVPDAYYSLGLNRDERTCLIFLDNKWLVYYSERGRMEDLKAFEEFDDARAYLLSMLQ